MTTSATHTIGRRLAGARPSRTRAFVAATMAGTATSVVVYRWLRRGTDAQHDD